MSHDPPDGGPCPGDAAGAAPGVHDQPDGAPLGDAPDHLDFAFADLKSQLAEQVGRLARLAHEVAMAAAARIDADAAIAETALGSLELEPRKRRRRRAQVKRLERLLARVSALGVEPARGRRRDLRRVGKAVRRIVTALTEPAE